MFLTAQPAEHANHTLPLSKRIQRTERFRMSLQGRRNPLERPSRPQKNPLTPGTRRCRKPRHPPLQTLHDSPNPPSPVRESESERCRRNGDSSRLGGCRGSATRHSGGDLDGEIGSSRQQETLRTCSRWLASRVMHHMSDRPTRHRPRASKGQVGASPPLP